MRTIFRSGLVLGFIVAVSSGCSSIDATPVTASPYTEGAITLIPPASPSLPSPAGLDDYKTLVARHVLKHNLEHSYDGTLPPLLPAIVVLQITVDRDGQLQEVEVQRSRDPSASEVALASLRRSAPLPRPQKLAQQGGKLTFSETFLFADDQRYQIRSLAGPQASE
jgi:protein TonB